MLKQTSVLLGVLLLCGPVWAENAEEKELKAAQQEVDQEAAASKGEAKVESLAQQFNVEPATVQQMRDKRQGWGEISTQLALAERLSKTDSATYPTTADALNKVGALRDEGKGYGVIAKELGFKLGPVVSGVKRSRDTIRSSARADRPERTGRIDRPERPERPDRPEKPNHPGNQR
ncbi:MAG: hypothetical protein Q7J69_06325 [Candidatus Omnitrophota bacterium]|nr:hypothetical protein [Candidatus Omnitrophota bacterium]